MNEELWYEYFGVIPFHTRGTAEGIVLRYRDFYLKAYNNSIEEYIIQGFRYGDEVPRFVDHVPLNRMRLYGAQFKKFGRRCG